MVKTKNWLRKEFLAKRQLLQEEEKRERNRRIIDNLLSLEELRGAEKILLYCAFKGEPDLSPLFGILLSQGKKVILPRVRGKELELVSITNGSCFTKGPFGIPEPSEGSTVYPQELELAVVPGIIFDRRGYRVGFGKGYYDRLLSKVYAPKVGVAYSFQVIDNVPAESWDVPVDILITEEEVLRWK